MKRRTVGIQIMPDMSIAVTVPFLFPKSKIEKVLKDHEIWIRQKQQVLQTRNTIHDKRKQEEYFYLGKLYPLEIRQNQNTLIELADKLYIASANQKYAKTYLTSWYKQQARKIIAERTLYYSHLSGLRYNTIQITSAETRWGSCSSEKNLNFNWKLIMAPLAVIDYVIAHELAHLQELNHSRSFWETVRKMYPLYRQYRTWLKRNGHLLHV